MKKSKKIPPGSAFPGLLEKRTAGGKMNFLFY